MYLRGQKLTPVPLVSYGSIQGKEKLARTLTLFQFGGRPGGVFQGLVLGTLSLLSE